MPIAQKFPTKEPYGCGIPLAGTSARAGSVDRIRRAGCHPAAFFLLTRRNRPSSPPPHIRFFHNSRKNSCIFQTTCYNNPHGTQSAPYFGPLAQLGERMVLKAGPENTPHQPIPFCIKKFRKHQKFGPLAQLGERMVLKAGPENAPHPPIPFCIKKCGIEMSVLWAFSSAGRANGP